MTTPAGELVDAVIVNWNGGREVVAAARSAVRFGAHAIVVDNGSEDDSATVVERDVPAATVLRLGYNAGFATACNVGASHCSAPIVLLLNPDAEVVDGSAASLVELFSTPDRPTIVGPTTIRPDGTLERTVRRLPTLTVLVLYQLKLHRLARWIAPLRTYFMLDFRGSEPARVEQVIGAALAIRREDWVRYGGLDEGYFLLFEEVDLCRRVADDGGFALYWPGITVRHIGSTSFRKLSHVQRQRIWNASLLRYARLHLGPAAAAILQLTFPVGLATGLVRDAVDRLSRSRTRPDSTTITR